MALGLGTPAERAAKAEAEKRWRRAQQAGKARARGRQLVKVFSKNNA